MNLKKLTTLLFAGVTAATPFATNAQNPTILQGNYVSNVFGQANFVLNPNAQTNVANVTLSGATAARSTTTPLVATSEWNVTVTSANGTAAWATRSFDEGMKNQNCEARFTYRGFQATSKAQIKQGANVVAELTLTPSATDPRIASINFPCGDLSAATTFVITDSATLSGVHEIGGIYVGLATNQANVAQAEFVGSLTWPLSVQNVNISSSTYVVFGALGSTNPTILGDVNFSTTAPKITVNNLKPGNYKITLSGMFLCFSSTSPDAYCGLRLTDGTSVFGSEVGFRSIGAISGNQGSGVPTVTFEFQYTGPTTSKTFQVEGYSGGTSGFNRIETNSTANRFQISVYRFPSSSELVVTPETQNAWGSVNLRGSGYSNQHTTSSWVKATSASTLTRTTYGKAKVETNNDFSITMENLPVGAYHVSVSGLFGVDGGTIKTYCRFGVSTSPTGSGEIAAVQQTSQTTFNTSEESDASAMSGIYNNTSVGTRTFYLQLLKAAGDGFCYYYTDSNSFVNITITPLDNASNSALYVQGPVKAAATGTAIQEPYQGFLGGTLQTNVDGFTYSERASYAPTTSATYQGAVGITLNAGLYWCSFNSSVRANSTTGWYSKVTIDGASAAGLNWSSHDLISDLTATLFTNKQISLPIYLTAQKTVRWSHRMSVANATQGYHEMWCMRMN